MCSKNYIKTFYFFLTQCSLGDQKNPKNKDDEENKKKF